MISIKERPFRIRATFFFGITFIAAVAQAAKVGHFDFEHSGMKDLMGNWAVVGQNSNCNGGSCAIGYVAGQGVRCTCKAVGSTNYHLDNTGPHFSSYSGPAIKDRTIIATVTLHGRNSGTDPGKGAFLSLERPNIDNTGVFDGFVWAEKNDHQPFVGSSSGLRSNDPSTWGDATLPARLEGTRLELALRYQSIGGRCHWFYYVRGDLKKTTSHPTRDCQTWPEPSQDLAATFCWRHGNNGCLDATIHSVIIRTL